MKYLFDFDLTSGFGCTGIVDIFKSVMYVFLWYPVIMAGRAEILRMFVHSVN